MYSLWDRADAVHLPALGAIDASRTITGTLGEGNLEDFQLGFQRSIYRPKTTTDPSVISQPARHAIGSMFSDNQPIYGPERSRRHFWESQAKRLNLCFATAMLCPWSSSGRRGPLARMIRIEIG